MNSVFKIKSCAFAALLLVLSMQGQALTLGRAKGAAIVAQPLSLTVSISAAPDEDVANLCFEADVFYGENKVDGSKVGLSGDAAAPGQTWQVRINSKLPVDEPVVTVYLRSTCAAKTSRRYVLLADVASDVATVGQPIPSNSLAKVSQLESVQATSGMVNQQAVETEGLKKLSKPKVPVVKQAPSSVVSVAKPSSNGKARLKLAPLDLSVERDPTLRASLELLTTPTEDVQKRGEAAALWRALNLSPEDVLQDTARLKGLEISVQKLSEASSQNQRQVNDLMTRLERAESERYWNPMVLGLGGLILLMAIGGYWFFRRYQTSANGMPWWSADANGPDGPESASSALVNLSPSRATLADQESGFATKIQPATKAVGSAAGTVDIDLDLDSEVPVQSQQNVHAPDNVSLAVSAGTAKASRLMGIRDFSNSVSATLREINTQEMLDIRQQAEFFMALGRYDDAIALLEGHIADSVEFNPSVYLDLLKIFHTLSRKVEFDLYRNEFNAVFSGQAPEYGSFQDWGNGLDAYPEMCDQLVKLWPSREALDFLELCMVRQPDAAAHLEIELEAFKELLLLHAIGSRLVNALDGPPVAFSASKVAAKEAMGQRPVSGAVEVALPVLAGASQEVDFELDIPDQVSEPEGVPTDNLIDYDVSGMGPTTDMPTR